MIILVPGCELIWS